MNEILWKRKTKNLKRHYKAFQAIFRILPGKQGNWFTTLCRVLWKWFGLNKKITGFGTGIKKKSEHFCWVMPLGNHVTLGFDDSVEPPDPKSLLEVYPLLIGLRDSEKKRFGKKSGSFSQRRTESRTKNSIEPF